MVKQGELVTDRITMTTGLLAHRLVARIVFTGKTLGLDIAHEHDGGRLTRHHLLTVSGTPLAVAAFRGFVADVAKMSEGS